MTSKPLRHYCSLQKDRGTHAARFQTPKLNGYAPRLCTSCRGQNVRTVQHITPLFVMVCIISPSYLLDRNFKRDIYVFEFFIAKKIEVTLSI